MTNRPDVFNGAHFACQIATAHILKHYINHSLKPSRCKQTRTYSIRSRRKSHRVVPTRKCWAHLESKYPHKYAQIHIQIYICIYVCLYNMCAVILYFWYWYIGQGKWSALVWKRHFSELPKHLWPVFVCIVKDAKL